MRKPWADSPLAPIEVERLEPTPDGRSVKSACESSQVERHRLDVFIEIEALPEVLEPRPFRFGRSKLGARSSGAEQLIAIHHMPVWLAALFRSGSSAAMYRIRLSSVA